jgi:hypothetical protein
MENGSGGFLADLTFVGGHFGFVVLPVIVALANNRHQRLFRQPAIHVESSGVR